MSDLDALAGSASARESTTTKAHSKTAQEAKEEWDRRTRENMLLRPETRRGHLKIRGMMKQWAHRFCVLRPPVLLIFKEEADLEKQNAAAIIYLRGCSCTQRISKMEGFCFRIFHNMKQSIFYNKGLRGESLGKTLINADELLLLAADNQTGVDWINAIREGISVADNSRTTRFGSISQLARNSPAIKEGDDNAEQDNLSPQSGSIPPPPSLPAPKPALDLSVDTKEDSAAESASASESSAPAPAEPVAETPAVPTTEPASSPVVPAAASATPAAEPENPVDEPKHETTEQSESPAVPATTATTETPEPAPKEPADASAAKDTSNVAKVALNNEELYTLDGVVDGSRLEPGASLYQKEIPREEMTFDAFEQGKGIIMSLVKQIRPGMDLSRIVLPTHILEPRSFLEKMTDYFSHIELISDAVHKSDPVERILALSRWYISGFHIQPKTPKKPYNPILGETFRCMWKNDGTQPPGAPPSQSFLICEQVSHHPPISALYACNRADGWIINGAIIAKSKFWGTSVGALLDGTVTMYLPEHGEEYVISFPSALAKGFIIGPLTMEMYGKITISCAKTGLKSTIEFKTKPTFGDEFNRVAGHIKNADGQTLYSFTGHYDTEVFYHEGPESAKDKPLHSLWKVEEDPFANSVQRWTIPFDQQGEFESERLWDRVTKALIAGDQNEATEGKTVLEEAQRKGARERAANKTEWVPKYFCFENGEWKYRWLKTDMLGEGEVGEYEKDHHIQPITKEAFERSCVVRAPESDEEEEEEEAPQPQVESAVSTTESDKNTSADSTENAQPTTAGVVEKNASVARKKTQNKSLKALQSTIEAHSKEIERLTQQIRSLERAATAATRNASKQTNDSGVPTVVMLIVGFLLLIQLWRISSAVSALPQP